LAECLELGGPVRYRKRSISSNSPVRAGRIPRDLIGILAALLGLAFAGYLVYIELNL